MASRLSPGALPCSPARIREPFFSNQAATRMTKRLRALPLSYCPKAFHVEQVGLEPTTSICERCSSAGIRRLFQIGQQEIARDSAILRRRPGFEPVGLSTLPMYSRRHLPRVLWLSEEATKMTRDCTAFLTHPPRGVTAVSRFRIRTVSTMYSHRHSPQDRSSVVISRGRI